MTRKEFKMIIKRIHSSIKELNDNDIHGIAHIYDSNGDEELFEFTLCGNNKDLIKILKEDKDSMTIYIPGDPISAKNTAMEFKIKTEHFSVPDISLTQLDNGTQCRIIRPRLDWRVYASPVGEI